VIALKILAEQEVLSMVAKADLVTKGEFDRGENLGVENWQIRYEDLLQLWGGWTHEKQVS